MEIRTAEDVDREWLQWLKLERDRLQRVIDEIEKKIISKPVPLYEVTEYDKKDAAAFLGVTIRTIESLSSLGKLKPRYVSARHGRKAVYREDELLRLRDLYAAADSPTSTARPGFVYILGTPDGYYKIGLSRVHVRRIVDIRLQLPYPAELIHLIATQNMGAAERELHQRFAHCRMNGEWFRLSVAEVIWLKQQKALEAA